MTERKEPCLCIECPQCGAVFFARALNEEFNSYDKGNKEFLNTIVPFAELGYSASFKDASEFKINYCEHVKN